MTEINIIGFDEDDEASPRLKEVAEAGSGECTSANRKQDLIISRNRELTRMQAA